MRRARVRSKPKSVGERFSGQLSGLDLRGMSLQDPRFDQAQVDDGKFSGGLWWNPRVFQTHINRSTFVGTRFLQDIRKSWSTPIFEQAVINGCAFDRASFYRVGLHSLTVDKTALERAKFIICQLYAVRLDDCNCSRALVFRGSMGTTRFARSNLWAARLFQCETSKVEIEKCDVRDGLIGDCALFSFTMRESDAERLRVRKSRLDGKLERCNLGDSVWWGVGMQARVVECDLRGSYFEGCDLANTSFVRCNLQDSVWVGCDLTRVRFIQCVGRPEVRN